MRLVIQRVQEATVEVDSEVVGSIQKGLLVFLGVGSEDDSELLKRYLDKMIKLRIFEDEEGKTNKSLDDVGGEILLVSQFTLYANCRKGNRPDFLAAAKPDMANQLYEEALTYVKDITGKVQAGIFGADMKISLVNDGPFTLVLDEHLFDK